MTIRIGLIGAGRMGNVHAGCMADLPAAKIVAVCDTILERAQAWPADSAPASTLTFEKCLARNAGRRVYLYADRRPRRHGCRRRRATTPVLH